jgi:hypothetical protein
VTIWDILWVEMGVGYSIAHPSICGQVLTGWAFPIFISAYLLGALLIHTVGLQQAKGAQWEKFCSTQAISCRAWRSPQNQDHSSFLLLSVGLDLWPANPFRANSRDPIQK